MCLWRDCFFFFTCTTFYRYWIRLLLSLFAFFYSFPTLSYKHMEHGRWTKRPISRELICLKYLLFFLFFFISRNCNINIEQYCYAFHWNWIWLLNHWEWVCVWHVSFAFLWVVVEWIHFVSHCDRCVGRKCQPKVNKPHKKLHKNGKQTMLKRRTRIFGSKNKLFVLYWIENATQNTAASLVNRDDHFVRWNGRPRKKEKIK